MNTNAIPIATTTFGKLDDAGLPACGNCSSGEKLGFAFSYAFQPIVDLQSGDVFAHEALVRGPEGQSAMSLLSQISDDNRLCGTELAGGLSA